MMALPDVLHLPSTSTPTKREVYFQREVKTSVENQGGLSLFAPTSLQVIGYASRRSGLSGGHVHDEGSHAWYALAPIDLTHKGRREARLPVMVGSDFVAHESLPGGIFPA